MKTFIAIMLAGAMSIISLQAETEKKDDESLGQKASDAASTAVEKTKEAGHAVAKTTKQAAEAVVDAVTPDADANKVNVTVTEDSIDMPKSVEAGKTAFVVKNSGKEKHNFEVRGHGIDKKFILALAPDQTKVLHVDLKTGRYKAMCLMTDHEKKNIMVELRVK
jgi:iron uptake system EfeUOB component EfeO/EfeM